MKTISKINLREISEVLSEKELKNVVGGSGAGGNGGSGDDIPTCSKTCKDGPHSITCYGTCEEVDNEMRCMENGKQIGVIRCIN